MTTVFESDWLGSRPYFYSQVSGTGSACIHDVIDYRNLEFDADGLADYLDFGYCAFGYTPVRGVRFVRPNHRLVRDAAGRLTEQPLADPVDAWRGRRTKPGEVVDRLRAEVERWEAAINGEIVLPLSGGYDSRLLALLLRNRSRVRAFTYGVSRDQEKSHEVTRARLVAQRLNLQWERVELGRFHEKLGGWDDLFGISTHAHGMYHFEFFEHVRERVGGPAALASGVIGDAWAGSIRPLPANSPADLTGLGLSRGLHGSGDMSRLGSTGAHREEFWAARRHAFQDPDFQIVEVIRQKMILLSYLLTVPAHLGFQPWSPFLTPDVALSMMTLGAEQRENRRWQRELFERAGLAVEKEAGGSRQNVLDISAVEQAPPPPLDARLLGEVVDAQRVQRINQALLQPGAARRWWAQACGHPPVVRLCSLLRAPNPVVRAYGEYVTLKPIENLLRRRRQA